MMNSNGAVIFELDTKKKYHALISRFAAIPRLTNSCLCGSCRFLSVRLTNNLYWGL